MWASFGLWPAGAEAVLKRKESSSKPSDFLNTYTVINRKNKCFIYSNIFVICKNTDFGPLLCFRDMGQHFLLRLIDHRVSSLAEEKGSVSERAYVLRTQKTRACKKKMEEDKGRRNHRLFLPFVLPLTLCAL